MTTVTITFTDIETLDELDDVVRLVRCLALPGFTTVDSPLSGDHGRLQFSCDLAEVPVT